MYKILFSVISVFLFTRCFGKVNQTKLEYEEKTFVYKVMGQDSIKSDFFRTTSDAKPHPIIVWLHGGALIFGSRNDLPKEQLEFYLSNGYSVLTIDYRLAPETKLSEIIGDVKDAVVWVQNNYEQLRIDPQNIYVMGHSAGGYLALITGYSLKTPPRAIISFYGYGDIQGDWYKKPNPYYLKLKNITEEQAFKLIYPSVITSASYEKRFDLYLYTRQQGIWANFVSGHDLNEEPGYFNQFCPIKNINYNYPPVILIHGDKDTDVPFEQSVLMNEALKDKNIDHQFIKMTGSNHVFDYAEGGLSNTKIKNAFDEVIRFMDKHKK